MTLRLQPEWLSAPGHESGTTELPPDEATLAAIKITVAGQCLSRLTDESGKERDYVCVSGYRLACWITRNWWRLLFEAERHGFLDDPTWLDGHSLASIGEGWLWPRITIASDGDCVVLRSRPSPGNRVEPLAFVSEAEARPSRPLFEEIAGQFVKEVLDRVRTRNLGASDLHMSWRELSAERSDDEIAQYRELEGSLGYEPDGAAPQTVKRLYRDGKRLGVRAMTEVAANGPSGGEPLTAEIMEREARNSGFQSDLGSTSQVADLADDVRVRKEPAWAYGEDAARRVRRRAGLSDGPLKNQSLAELSGVTAAGVVDDTRFEPMAYALSAGRGPGRVVFRSQWETGRRFELGRLLGDAVLFRNGERLQPTTRAETFRQRAQRAFAAELLCPYEALRDFLGGDTTDMAREEAARLFGVSMRAVTTMLVNKGDLSRDHLPLWGN
ncbi:MAG: hypothetical protein OXC11_14380 [Rhodospirillales bacterium]|nr:hypothetical protein [Rhodospirillales bacterium]